MNTVKEKIDRTKVEKMCDLAQQNQPLMFMEVGKNVRDITQKVGSLYPVRYTRRGKVARPSRLVYCPSDGKYNWLFFKTKSKKL